MTFLHGWAPVLRMARRDVRRSRARSILVLVLIALPVLAVTAADVVYQTSQVSSVEALDRELGSADAKVQVLAGQSEVVQGFDPDDLGSASYDEGYPEPTPDDLRAALGRKVPMIASAHGDARFVTNDGFADVGISELDLRDPLTEGIFESTAGRLPRSAGEIVVNAALAERGPAVGSILELTNGTTYDVVGLVESSTLRDGALAVALPGAFGLSGDEPDRAGYATEYLVGGGPVTWDDVRALNAIGAVVTSREVLSHPPSASELPPEIVDQPGAGRDSATVAVGGLIVVMVLLEVVLLAGPAFAVSARRQSRTIALMAASGGTPGQARRLVLAGGLVLGSVAALLGCLLGIGVAALALPVLQRFSTTYFGPFEVPWLHLVGIGAFGLASALLAAVVPAWIASRQDVVAVLAGRRGDRSPSLRSPLLGVLLLGVGTVIVLIGATNGSGGEFAIAFGVLPAVIGMILLVPLVISGLARAGRGLPLTLRYAVRDAARHRTRTVPAVAAVAATVTGVVALGIGGASDQEESRAGYQPGLRAGTATLTDYEEGADWAAYRSIVGAALPGAEVREVRGVAQTYDPEATTWTELLVLAGGETPGGIWVGSSLGHVLVEDDAATVAFLGASDAMVAAARTMLASGGVVGFTDEPIGADEATIELAVRDNETGERLDGRTRTVPALWIEADGIRVPQAIVSTPVADELGLEVTTAALAVSDVTVDDDAEQQITEAAAALSTGASFYVERGYTQDEAWLIVLIILGTLGGVLVLGGTLTATFLAVSDARPDLATLAAVGAAPRTGRGVAASYAVVVGVTGATLGAAMGFLPGIAVTYPLTGDSWTTEVNPNGPSHYLDVPWLLIVLLVVVLPLLTAAIVGITARSRLPLVARLD